MAKKIVKNKTKTGEGLAAGQQISVMQHLSQAAASWLIGLAPRTLRELAAPRSEDGSYSGQSLVEWLIERKAEKIESDPLLSGEGNSPAIEEYRREKVREVKRKNDLEEGKLMPVADVSSAWATVGIHLRRELEAAILECDASSKVETAIWSALDRACDAILKPLNACDDEPVEKVSVKRKKKTKRSKGKK